MANGKNLDCVLLHGWGVTNNVWHNFCKGLNQFNNITSPNLYGVAKNINSRDIRVIAMAINKKIQSDCVLIGWSLGGLVATLIAEQSDKIKAVVYIATAPCFINNENWTNVIDVKDFEKLESKFLNDTAMALKYFAGLIASGDEAPKNTNKLIRQSLANTEDSATLGSWLEQMRKTEQRSNFSALKIPILILLGENDVLINAHIKNELTSLNPSAQANVLKNCGHAPFISNADQTIKLINEFIGRNVYG